jgi:predicted Zn finger-like uncharacterized protein
MIVKCEKCQSEFNFNENLLKKDGSMVRCSVCKNTFKVFPQSKEPSIEPGDDEFSNSAMEETVALDLPPELEDLEMDTVKEGKEYSFDKAFEEAMEEVSKDEDIVSSDDELEERLSESGDEEDEEDMEPEDKPEKKGKSKILLIVLSCIFFLVVVFLVIFFLFPSVIPDSIYSRHQETKQETKSTASEPGSVQLNFMGVKPAFSKSEKAGDLFLIKGVVINNDSKSRSHILLKGGILDKEGKLVREEIGYAGNNFSDDQLKQLSREEIKAAMQNRSGMNNSNVEVKPGATLNFMIIFMDLPEKGRMADLTVEAVSSTAGK